MIVDPHGRMGAVTIHQDVQIYSAVLAAGDRIAYDLPGNRFAWLQVVRGMVQLNGEELRTGDGVQMSGGQQLEISTPNHAELLLFDLA